MKKIISVILCVIMAFSLFSCSKGKDKSASASSSFKLPYMSSDSLSPYNCKSEVNFKLAGLIYDGLFKMSADRNPQKVLAGQYTFQDKVITVNLKSAKFSDGSAVSSEDVVYSFEKAKLSERYSAALTPVATAQKKGSSVIRFTLSDDDIYALNLLTFPIISKSSQTGTGIYAIERNDDEAVLVYNKYHDSDKPKIEKIELCECADYSGAVNLLNSGKIDYLFDELENGNIRSSTGKSTPAKMNNLIFMGINSNRPILKNKHFRRAIAQAINQKKLVEQAFSSYAFATATPFDPDWSDMGSVVATTVLSDATEAKDAFGDAGLKYDKLGVNLVDDDGEQITLNLIVNSANNMKIAAAEEIKTQLINCGILVEIQKMPLDEYNIAVENGNFDLYIGEVKIPNDFSLDCFFGSGGADFGINSKKLKVAHKNFMSGQSSLQDFVSAFCDENPFVPLAYKGADACANSALEADLNVRENDIYSGIENWSI